MKYEELALKAIKNEKQLKYKNGTIINVKQYLPISEKISLIDIALQNSLYDNKYYDPVLLEIMVNLYIVFCYTDIEFTEEEKSDPARLYDELITNGYLGTILNAIPEEEYNDLLKYLNEKKEVAEKYKGSLMEAITTLVTEFPKSAEEARNIVDNFDVDKYENVVNFAKAVNNGNLPQ